MDPQVQKFTARKFTARKFTAKGMATRQRIIEGAAAEIRVNGAVATTLDDVMARTGTSKSQLFHYFPHGKEQLLLAVAELEAARVLSDQQPHLSKLTSWAAWQRWRDVVVERYRKQGQQCPLSTVMSEMGRTPGAQAVTSALIVQWRTEIESGVRAMQQQGKIAESVDPGRTAAALLAGIQGGVSVLLNTGDIGYLEAALDVGIANLRK
jgi:AcrR family transcriptional regulator